MKFGRTKKEETTNPADDHAAEGDKREGAQNYRQ
jgi:hypothetical protein